MPSMLTEKMLRAKVSMSSADVTANTAGGTSLYDLVFSTVVYDNTVPTTVTAPGVPAGQTQTNASGPVNTILSTGEFTSITGQDTNNKDVFQAPPIPLNTPVSAFDQPGSILPGGYSYPTVLQSGLYLIEFDTLPAATGSGNILVSYKITPQGGSLGSAVYVGTLTSVAATNQHQRVVFTVLLNKGDKIRFNITDPGEGTQPYTPTLGDFVTFTKISD